MDRHGSDPGDAQLFIDCDSCRARGPACGDCVVSVLLGAPQERMTLDDDERAALAALAHSGLVPPLRLVPGARPGRPLSPPPEWAVGEP